MEYLENCQEYRGHIIQAIVLFILVGLASLCYILSRLANMGAKMIDFGQHAQTIIQAVTQNSELRSDTLQHLFHSRYQSLFLEGGLGMKSATSEDIKL